MICEGFQMILKMQADALVTLGVSTHFRVSTSIRVWYQSPGLIPESGFSTRVQVWYQFEVLVQK